MKSLLKKVFQALAIIIMLPLILLYFLLRLFGNKDEALSCCSQIVSLLPGKLGSYLRVAFYRLALKKCDPEVFIGFGSIFSQADTEIEKGAYIGPQCNIGLCKIGKNTLLGSGVHILSGKHQHNFDDPNTPIKDQGGHFEKVLIDENCWLGNGAIVMCSIGPGVIVAAGAVVIKELEGKQIVAGNPAKLIKTL